MGDRLVLKTALGKHDCVKALKDGRVKSERVEFEFLDFNPMPQAFRLMVRGGDIDVSEMAVCTHVMAHHYGKPITALAIPVWSRLPHTNLICKTDAPIGGPKDLEGKKVGVRAYAQTSGVWVRGILKDEYGVDLESITWVTMEDAHLAEYSDPPIAVRNTSGLALRPQLVAGELAAIMGEREIDPAGIRPVIPDAEQAANTYIARTGIVPLNHVVAVQTRHIEENPWLAQELFRLFDEARRIGEAEGGEAPAPYGLEKNRRSLQLAIDYSFDQRLIPRAYRVDEMFHPV